MSRARPFLAGLLALALPAGCGADAPVSLLSARRGDFEVVLRLRGSLRPVKEVSIKSPRWGEIRRMAPNGSRVKAGQVVLELDSEDTENWIRDRRADVEVRETELRQVEKEVEQSRRRAKLRREAARLNRQLEEAKLKELLARPTARELTDAKSRLELAEALLKAGAESLLLAKELVASGYAAGEELRAAELDLARAQADLAAARANFQTVRAGVPVSEEQQAAIKLKQAELAERAAEKSVQVTGEWADAKLARFARRVEREKEKLAEAERQLLQYQARSPDDGVVLYSRRRWGGIWQPGQHAWQGATIMSIPDLSKMKVTIQVPAGAVRQIEAAGNVPARVRALALPEKTFTGKLTKIGTVGRDEFEGMDPSSERLGRAERQVFEAEVEIQEEDGRLKPGFNAEAELILSRVEGAVIVPRLALIEKPAAPEKRRRGGRGPSEDRAPETASVYVRVNGSFEERTVRVLAKSRFEAAVEGPVEAGDLLYPGRPPGGSPGE